MEVFHHISESPYSYVSDCLTLRRRVDGLRGLWTTKTLKKDETILRVPLNCCAYSDTFMGVVEKVKNDDYTWYRNCIDENENFAGPYLPKGEGLQYCETLKYFLNDSSVRLKGETLYAACLVMSRSFTVALSDNDVVRIVIPGVDLCNHSESKFNIRFRVVRNIDENDFVIEASTCSPVCEGSELLLSYGNHPPSVMLHNYNIKPSSCFRFCAAPLDPCYCPVPISLPDLSSPISYPISSWKRLPFSFNQLPDVRIAIRIAIKKVCLNVRQTTSGSLGRRIALSELVGLQRLRRKDKNMADPLSSLRIAGTPAFGQVLEYAKWVGLDLATRNDLMWLAEKGLCAPLPKGWTACSVDGGAPQTTSYGNYEGTAGDVYYFNEVTGESLWDHPLDGVFRELAKVFSRAAPPDPIVAAKRRRNLIEYLRTHDIGTKLNRIEFEDDDSKPKVSKVNCATQVSIHSSNASEQVEVEAHNQTTQTSINQSTTGTHVMPSDSQTMTSAMVCNSHTMTVDEGIVLSPRNSTVALLNSVDHMSVSDKSGLNGTDMKESTTTGEELSGVQAVTSEVLVKEMLASFQQQLLEHRREIHNSIAHDRDTQQQLVNSLSGSTKASVQPPHVFPPPARTIQSPDWSKLEWIGCYGFILLVHLAICFCFALGSFTILPQLETEPEKYY